MNYLYPPNNLNGLSSYNFQPSQQQMSEFNSYIKTLKEYSSAQGTMAYEQQIGAARSALEHFAYLPTLAVPEPIVNFRKNLFPEWLMLAAQYLAANYGIHENETLHMLLPIAGAASCGRLRVRLTPEWVESVCGIHILGKPSGTKKTAIINAIASPLFNLESELQQKFLELDLEINNKEQKVAADSYRNQERAKLLKQYSKNEISEDIFQERIKDYMRKAKNIENNEHNLKYMPSLHDTCPTRAHLIYSLFGHGGHCNLIGSEDPFINLKCRTSPESATLLLQLTDHGTIKHKGQGGKLLIIPNASLTVVSAFQVDEILKYYRSESLLSCGLLNRFAVCFGTDKSGLITQEYNISSCIDAYEKFKKAIKSIISKFYSQLPKNEIVELKVEHGALREIERYKDSNAYKYYPTRMQGYLSKSHGLAVRYAAYLHLLKNSNTLSLISLSEMQAGIEMAQMLESHASYFFNHEIHQINADAKRIVRFLIKRKCFDRSRFFISDITKNLNDMNRNRALSALEHLENMKYLIIFHKSRCETECVVNQHIFDDYWKFKFLQ